MSSRSQPNIYFFFQHPTNLRNRRRLKEFIAEIFRNEFINLDSLNYIFCSDDELLRINKQYLKHDFYTDIITFELSERGQPITGEIYISIDRVRENAHLQNTTISQELHRVVFHGALHLCGYRDKTPTDKRKMTEMEDFYLHRFSDFRST